ncbi:MAG: F0F1 ATP synthase subunit C [Clostridiales bacterium]|nr:F0F1 ATP synthase subunit C [Clostridiales bacterium]
MDAHVAHLLAAGFTFGMAALAAAIGDGIMMAKALEGMARQPEMRGPLQVTMFIGVGLIEALPIIVVVLAAFVIK